MEFSGNIKMIVNRPPWKFAIAAFYAQLTYQKIICEWIPHQRKSWLSQGLADLIPEGSSCSLQIEHHFAHLPVIPLLGVTLNRSIRSTSGYRFEFDVSAENQEYISLIEELKGSESNDTVINDP